MPDAPARERMMNKLSARHQIKDKTVQLSAGA
jgi:hypothetical protein